MKYVSELFSKYIDEEITGCKVIDSSREEDFRMNYIINERYVLRVNSASLTEERLAEIDRLQKRYNYMGIKAPALYRNKDGRYLLTWEDKVCYLTDYINEKTLPEINEKEEIIKEVFIRNGEFAQQYKNVDLINTRSMWSVIKLAPLDNEIDEKQENLNLLINALRQHGENELADELARTNEEIREVMAEHLDELPECVIQGDLNESNILVRDGHFHGLIDFNMAGTEVIINQFCCESNVTVEETDFDSLTVNELYEKVMNKQNEYLDLMNLKYEMNELEKRILPYYRKLAMISQYPNVCAYIYLLKKDKAKVADYLKLCMK
ncbi:MAG: phosphotransferase [Erysipelotrichaceae bacterium]|nr:phosphotransferase [Erysipelotrichaceae bacterium]